MSEVRRREISTLSVVLPSGVRPSAQLRIRRLPSSRLYPRAAPRAVRHHRARTTCRHNNAHDNIGKPSDYGSRVRANYIANDYRKPTDEVTSDWDMAGIVDNALDVSRYSRRGKRSRLAAVEVRK